MALPHIDSHSVEVGASREQAWAALVRTLAPGRARPVADAGARALGVRDARATGEFPAVGSTMRGFRVDACEPPVRLLLAGRHRFAEYELEFAVEDLGGARSRVTAETRASFPGARGRAYRALVIGTRGHVVAVRRLLGRIRTAAAA